MNRGIYTKKEAIALSNYEEVKHGVARWARKDAKIAKHDRNKASREFSKQINQWQLEDKEYD